jgi:hypothetical protein
MQVEKFGSHSDFIYMERGSGKLNDLPKGTEQLRYRTTIYISLCSETRLSIIMLNRFCPLLDSKHYFFYINRII